MAPPWTLPLVPLPDFLTRKPPGAAPAAGGGSGSASAAGASTYTLPPELKAGLQKAWDASFPGGKSQEQGGILVRNKDGSLEWKAGAPGSSGSFSVNYADVGADQTLVAAAHTHPYDASEKSYTDVSFSGADLARLTTVPEDRHLARSGDTLFMVAKTPEFEKLVKDKGAATVDAEMRKAWNDARATATGTFQERIEAAVRKVCDTYHLEYYRGTGDTLTKVDVSK